MSVRVLASDVGGTTTRVALLEAGDGTISLLERRDYESQRLDGLYPTLAAELERGSASSARPTVCVVSGAGPVYDNRCRLSNLDWIIDGDELTQRLSLPTFVIQDFSAVCCGIAVLRRCRPQQLAKIDDADDGPRPDAQDADAAPEAAPDAANGVSAVVGPGTGLGVGFILQTATQRIILPSEAGHSDFAPGDEEMEALHHYARARFSATPSFEQILSGRGLSLLLDFMLTRAEGGPVAQMIATAPPEERPALISAHSQADEKNDEGIVGVTRLFMRCLARFCTTVALTCEPLAGLYLAGGILPKNENWVVGQSDFMRSFRSHNKASVRPLLASIGISLVRDPNVALYGNADWGLERIGAATATTLLLGQG